MSENVTTTICALSTAPAPAGVAIIRISGKNSKDLLTKAFKANPHPCERARELCLGTLINEEGTTLDTCLAVFFKGPASFTGEDSAEIHCHGNPLLISKILRTLLNLGANAAAPGEFTSRAFKNGKLDLLQAESLADLISATSDRALKLAQDNLAGSLSQTLVQVGEPLRDVLAEIEASIDFPEEDIQPDTISALQKKIQGVQGDLSQLLSTYSYGQTLKEGLRVLICGKPNVGKSSILNALLGRKRAIVSDVAGTTRDTIEESLDLEGYRVLLCDSAGIREQTTDRIEQIGIELALEKIPWADLILVVDSAETQDEAVLIPALTASPTKKILIQNKIDVKPPALLSENFKSNFQQVIPLSIKSGEGLTELRNCLIAAFKSHTASVDNSSILTSERQRSALTRAQNYLQVISQGLQSGQALEFIASDLRACLRELEELVGITYTEDILGRIFSKFCIGK